MKQLSQTLKANRPDAVDFASRFPQYGPRAQADTSSLFDTVMSGDTFNDAEVLTRCLGLPAVTAVAAQLVGEPELSNTDRQYIGALVCCLMEANGYRKSGVKRSIPIPGWSKGEVYVEDKDGGQ